MTTTKTDFHNTMTMKPNETVPYPVSSDMLLRIVPLIGVKNNRLYIQQDGIEVRVCLIGGDEAIERLQELIDTTGKGWREFIRVYEQTEYGLFATVEYSCQKADPLKSCSKCSRCGGIGRISRFKHIANGVCFSCQGAGIESRKSWLQIKSVQSIELTPGSTNFHADVLLQNGQVHHIPIVGGESAADDLDADSCLQELTLMQDSERGQLFFIRKNTPWIEEDADEDDDSYEPEEQWTDEDICNAAFDGQWDIYAHHCGY